MLTFYRPDRTFSRPSHLLLAILVGWTGNSVCDRRSGDGRCVWVGLWWIKGSAGDGGGREESQGEEGGGWEGGVRVGWRRGRMGEEWGEGRRVGGAHVCIYNAVVLFCLDRVLWVRVMCVR